MNANSSNSPFDYPFLKEIGSTPVIFVHIPRTGGTSIAKALQMPLPNRDNGIRKHYTSTEIKQIVGEPLWHDSFRFSFVRNPWTRLWSHYCYRKHRRVLKKQEHYHDFTLWVTDELVDHPRKRNNLSAQNEWLFCDDDRTTLDFIGSFENLVHDFYRLKELLAIKENLDLPHLGAASTVLSPGQFSEVKSKVQTYYRADFELFGYCPDIQ